MSQGWNCQENIMQVTRGGQRQQELVTIIIFFQGTAGPAGPSGPQGAVGMRV